jgi:Tol biopolymer transport system component
MTLLATLVLTYACSGCLAGGHGGIVSVHADGTHRQTVLVAPRGHFLWQPTWAPDGKRFAYVDEFPAGRRRLWITRPGAGRGRPLTRPNRDAFYPVWSPDGKRIAFVRDYDLWVVGTGGGERLLFRPRTGGIDEAATWSPDGRRLAFVANDRLYVVRADGGGLRFIPTPHTFMGKRVSTPAWSPDGRALYYFSGPDNAYVPWVPHRHDLRTGRDNYFLARPGADYVDAAWTRDCRLFAYALLLPVGGAGAADLWILRFSDRRRIHVTKVPGDIAGVSWKP